MIAEPDGTFVGTLEEDFAIESNAGDIFQLGNTAWRIRRVEAGRVRVEDAKACRRRSRFGSVKRRRGRRSSRSRSPTFGRDIGTRLDAGDPEPEIAEWLERDLLVSRVGAQQLVHYIAVSKAMLGVLPTVDTVVAERFFDEGGGMQLVIHAPFGGRINKAWGLALRKKFCRSFNFELQAAATDDGLIISLGPVHSSRWRRCSTSYLGEPGRDADASHLADAGVRDPVAARRADQPCGAALAQRQEGASSADAHARRRHAHAGLPDGAGLSGQHRWADRAAVPPAGGRSDARLPARVDGHERARKA